MTRARKAWAQGILTTTPWRDLRLGRRYFPERGYAVSPRDYVLDGGLRFTYGLSEEGRPGIFVEWPNERPITDTVQTEALRLDVSTMPGWRALRIECRDPDLEDVFWRFVQALFTILQEDTDGDDALSAFLRAYEEFMHLLRDPGRGAGIGIAQIIGLAGELYTLLQLLRDANVAKSVEAWHGPFGSARDFVFTNAELEVKAHLGEAPRAIPISSIYQLSRPGNVAVFLSLVHFTLGTEWTISGLIERIRRETSVDDQGLLTERLANAGYVEQTKQHWDRLALDVYGQWYFEVQDNFPRIAPETLTNPDFAQHFLITNYHLAITAITPFEVNSEEVHALIRSETR